MNPKITIAIPVYNVEKYVEKALLSVLNQTYNNIEILVIDDKGSDRSMEIATEILNTHRRASKAKIIDHVYNQGLGATRNTAIREATGDYIMFMDSDDYISADCVERLVKKSEEGNFDLVIGSFEHVPVNGGKHIPFILPSNVFNGESAYEDYYRSKGFYIQTWNKLFRLSLLREGKVHCIPSNRNEDIFFSFQLFPLVKSIITSSTPTYFYSIGDENATTYGMRNGTVKDAHIVQFLGILDEMYSMIKKKWEKKPPRAIAEYFLGIKSGLIKEIANARNFDKDTKLNYLLKVPKYDEIDWTEGLEQLSAASKNYLRRDPLKMARNERIKKLPIRILRKIKHIIPKI